MKKCVLLIILFLGLSVFSYSQSETFSRIKIHLEENTFIKLGELGIAPEGYVHKGLYLILEVESFMLSRLTDVGIMYEILIDDVSKFYEQRNYLPVDKIKFPYCILVPDYPVPANFKLGSMGGYFTLNEIYQELDTMRILFPALISQRQTIGSFLTHQNSPLYYVRISNNPDIVQNKPRVFYLSLVHAREPMGMQQLFFFMWYLLENYNSNTEIQYILDNSELYFVLCANPDGYEYNRQTNPSGGGMWRKNRRNNGAGSFGVDINRNFGYMWGYDNIGSSPDPNSQVYRGPNPFSEPETQAIKWLCETFEPKFLLDYHTYSDVLIYPWGYISEKTPDSTLYDIYSLYLTSENKFFYGTCYETIGYNANGVSADWYYGEQTTKNKIIAWTPEAGNPTDGFWPEQNKITDIAKYFFAMNMYLIRFALKYSEIKEHYQTFIYGNNHNFIFDIQRLGIDSTGTYTVILHPYQNVSSTGNPVIYTDLQLLETRTDTISYFTVPTIITGDTVILIAETFNGYYSHFDTIRRIYGQPVQLFADDGSSFNNWTGDWGITDEFYVSPPSSITDSPYQNYYDDTIFSITTQQQIDLTGTVAAYLSFFARWNIEKGFDYVQVLISDDNGLSWTPLCGKYSQKGTFFQAEGEPVYDGVRNQWVYEQIDLSDWLGQEVKFKFTIVSDMYINADGFYFDDITVEALMDSTIQYVQNTSDNNINIYPNPADETVNIFAADTEISEVRIFNSVGMMVFHSDDIQNFYKINILHLPDGLYLIKLNTTEGVFSSRLIIQK